MVIAGAFGHPAFLKEYHFFNLKSKFFLLSMFKSLIYIRTKPLFLSCSEIDYTFDTQSRRRAIDILDEVKVPH